KGVHVYVERKLLDAGKKVVDEAMRNLELRIDEVTRSLPATPLASFRKVNIWVIFRGEGARYINVATGPRMADDFIELAKGGGIEVSATEVLLEPKSIEWAHYCRYWLIHEFAHAYHDRVVGFEDYRVHNAFEAAKDRKLYDSVETRRVNKQGKTELVNLEAYAN